MKKLQFQFALALLSICVVASCNTIAGMGRDAEDTVNWANDKPSTIGKVIGDAPSGYREQPAKSVMPPQDTENSSAPDDQIDAESPQPLNVATPAMRPTSGQINGSKLVWNKINHYNAEDPALPGDEQNVLPASVPSQPASAPVVQYGHSVEVFPVNGDISPYTQINSVEGNDIGGEMVQQIFFAHGSDKISRIDNRNLHELAQSLVKNTSDYKLQVVGHASRRVNNVTDRMEKKMINFKMAQKRANAVASQLISAGATPGWVIATSMGDEQPNLHRDGKTQEAADRRAEVFLSTN